MKRIYFRKNEKAQVLGLPMYLIIIMIIAIVVIAAVIFMMPKGTQKCKGIVTDGFLLSSDAGAGGAEFTFGGESVKVKVTDMDGNPISGAKVTLTGAGVAESDFTDSDGTKEFTISPTLPENIDELYITMRVKADGYDDFEDQYAIQVVRVY